MSKKIIETHQLTICLTGMTQTENQKIDKLDDVIKEYLDDPYDSAYLKKEVEKVFNPLSIKMTIDTMYDTILALCKGIVTIETVRDFFFRADKLEGLKLRENNLVQFSVPCTSSLPESNNTDCQDQA